MEYYPRRTRFIKRTVSAEFETEHGTAPAQSQAERIAARLAELRAPQTPSAEKVA